MGSRLLRVGILCICLHSDHARSADRDEEYRIFLNNFSELARFIQLLINKCGEASATKVFQISETRKERR